jgi:uncharacterized protein YndB with AHSA1/START domain
MAKQVAEVVAVIEAEAARVWSALTGEDGAMMPGTRIETDWQVGHPIVFSGEWKGMAFKDYGEIQQVDPEYEVSFTHWSGSAERPADYHIVRYRLEPEGRGTRVTLTQFNVGPKAEVDEATRAEFEKNWRAMLDGLKKSAEAH